MTAEEPPTLRERIVLACLAHRAGAPAPLPLSGLVFSMGDIDRAVQADAETLADAIIAAIGEGWRPISEAPRDGTTILVASARGDVGEAYYGIGRGWQHIVGSRLGQKMTHWRPLPPAPSPSPPPLGDA